MLHDPGLGQAGGAGGVDIEARVIEEDLRGAGRILQRALGTDRHQVDITVGHLGGLLIGDEPGSISLDRDLITHGFIGGHQFRTDNNGHWAHQVQAVHQRRLGLRSVEHRADATQLGHGEHVQK